MSVLSYRVRHSFEIARQDWVLFLLAISAVPAWVITSDPLLAVVFLTLADSILVDDVPRRMISREQVAAFFEERNGIQKNVPESVAPLAVYLASDASDWVSGQIIFLGGDSLALVRHPMEDRFAFRPEGWDVDSIEQHFRHAFETAVEWPSMSPGPYRWFDGIGS